MKDIRRNVRIMFIVLVIFICNKFFLRPYVIKNDFPEFLNVFVLSFPNLCEAIVGGLLITNIGLLGKQRFLKTSSNITENHVYLFAVLVTGLYVLLQEFKIHNLGGNNVYDPFDILFSIIGLIIVSFILLYFKPVISIQKK
ncbi:hypothetical protein [uncultured Aquimarina sp.]|uniref:hypothetical protein n=1 Tax=uncultured Aquimarina sp. TaxID=575652 RepID=UPI00261B059D|nr:hypothetical protein [uncultured Aquimarina sp.]